MSTAGQRARSSRSVQRAPRSSSSPGDRPEMSLARLAGGVIAGDERSSRDPSLRRRPMRAVDVDRGHAGPAAGALLATIDAGGAARELTTATARVLHPPISGWFTFASSRRPRPPAPRNQCRQVEVVDGLVDEDAAALARPSVPRQRVHRVSTRRPRQPRTLDGCEGRLARSGRRRSRLSPRRAGAYQRRWLMTDRTTPAWLGRSDHRARSLAAVRAIGFSTTTWQALASAAAIACSAWSGCGVHRSMTSRRPPRSMRQQLVEVGGDAPRASAASLGRARSAARRGPGRRDARAPGSARGPPRSDWPRRAWRRRSRTGCSPSHALTGPGAVRGRGSTLTAGDGSRPPAAGTGPPCSSKRRTLLDQSAGRRSSRRRARRIAASNSSTNP